jgi:hypothetical protein
MSGSWLAAAVAVDYMRWVIIGCSNCCRIEWVGHGGLQQLLWDIIGGSWLAAAVAVDCMRWVMVGCSICCGLYEVGHGW